jgi:hypothetical protein
MGMWLFAAIDAWRTAQAIRSGITPDVAEDILVKRFSGNPKLWGIVLSVLGIAFLLQSVFNIRGVMRGLLPLLLIGLGVYILRGYIFKPKSDSEQRWPDFDNSRSVPTFASALHDPQVRTGEYPSQGEYRKESRFGGWSGR